jgi:hypothetical protein
MEPIAASVISVPKGKQLSIFQDFIPMAHDFRVGDHVEWNSEAGRVRGTIKKKNHSEIKFKGYTVHASKVWPQYLIQSEKALKKYKLILWRRESQSRLVNSRSCGLEQVAW